MYQAVCIRVVLDMREPTDEEHKIAKVHVAQLERSASERVSGSGEIPKRSMERQAARPVSWTREELFS